MDACFISDETLDQLPTPRKLARPESVAVRSTLGAIHSGYDFRWTTSRNSAVRAGEQGQLPLILHSAPSHPHDRGGRDHSRISAPSVMVTVAVRALAAVGVNVRLRRQLAPATTVAPFVQVVPAAMAKSPGFKPARTMLVMLRVAVPLLVRVTVCAGLVVLRR